MLSDDQLERYSRQLLVPEFDFEGQQKLVDSTVLIVGLGGLGCPAALYLAAAGVGNLVLADGDVVELNNLQRQIGHGTSDIGRNKAHSVAASIAALNPEVSTTVIPNMLDPIELKDLLEDVDLVIDATDNYPIRYTLNRACINAALPLVSAAAVRTEGQISVFDPAKGGPCYRCLYPLEGSDTALSCSESGVLAPVVGVIGSLLSMEAIKVLTGFGESLRGYLLILDLATMDIRRLALPPKTNCPDCSGLR